MHSIHFAADLPAARNLRLHRLQHLAVVALHHVGHDGLQAARRRLERRHLADARHAHVHRARDRCRGERQHVDGLGGLLDLLLLLDTEALLLVDDKEAK